MKKQLPIVSIIADCIRHWIYEGKAGPTQPGCPSFNTLILEEPEKKCISKNTQENTAKRNMSSAVWYFGFLVTFI